MVPVDQVAAMTEYLNPDWVLADYIKEWPLIGNYPPMPPDGYPRAHAAYVEWVQRRRSQAEEVLGR